MTEISQSNSINITVSVNAIRYKIIFVGDAGVGKTTIINRINDNEFQSSYDATIGVDFWPKKINFRGNEITLQIWDTAGQERYRGLIPSYVRNSSIVFIVFDITNRKTFESIPKWIELIKSIEKNIILVLIGNKEDLKEKREVEEKEGEDLAKENEMHYYELSAKNYNNNDIKKIFFNTVIELPTFSGYIDNKEKEGLIEELIQENKENKKDYLNINVKKENMLTIHNDKDNNNNNNNNNNNGANEIYRYNRANEIDRYNIDYTDSSLKRISKIRNDNTNSASRRGICSC